MEIMLLLLYYLSQNPDFPERVKPLMGQLKNSEEMLKFLNDLSRFSDIFSLFKKQEGGPDGPDRPSRPQSGGPNAPNAPPNGTGDPNAPDGGAPHSPPPKREKENPQTPTSGIADEFIEQCLGKYFKRH